MTNELFSPITLGGLHIANRIVVPPMCQYSAENGLPAPWHYVHYSTLSNSGAGLVMIEATAVEPEGRISYYDLGLWNDEQAEEHRKMISFIRAVSRTPLAVQLGHAGRKAGTVPPWQGGAPISPEAGAWDVCAPSANRYDPVHPVPVALDEDALRRMVRQYVDSAKRAAAAGYDAVEIHAAHGYLLHQFLSPLANTRSDGYAGSLENRMRYPLEVFAAVRAAFPAGKPVGVRISGSDFVKGGWDVESSIVFAKELEKAGCAFIHVSGGGLSPDQKIPLGPGYQVSMAARVKAAVSMPVIAVGLITDPELAAGIVLSGQADMVAIGRGMLYDPRWGWHAAAKLATTIHAPNQYLRCEPRSAKGLFIA